MKKIHQAPKSTNEQTLADYVTKEIKMYIGTDDNKYGLYKDMFQKCVKIVQERDVEKIPSYPWYKLACQGRTILIYIMREQYWNFFETEILLCFFKCKISVGEPGYPLAAVVHGKQVIVGKNETFQVADHDFSKLSIIPDGILIHKIPENNEEVQEDGDGDS